MTLSRPVDATWIAYALDGRHRTAAGRPDLPPLAAMALMAQNDWVTLHELANNPACPPAVLRQLAARTDRVGDSARRNPSLDYDIIADDAALTVWHPRCPPERFEQEVQQLLDEPGGLERTSTNVVRGIAASPLLSAERIQTLIALRNPITYPELLRNPQLTHHQALILLERAHQESSIGQRSLAHLWAENPAAPATWLAAHLQHQFPRMLTAVAGNPSTPPEALRKLAQQCAYDSTLPAQLLDNPSTDADTLTELQVKFPVQAWRAGVHPHANTQHLHLIRLDYRNNWSGWTYLRLLDRWCGDPRVISVAFSLHATWTGTFGELLDVAGGILDGARS